MIPSPSLAAWPASTLAWFGGADEIEISTRRRDGSLRPFKPIWIVAVSGDLYVRSYRGASGSWWRYATRDPAGAIRADGQQVTVTFAPAGQQRCDLMRAIDDAYRGKYARYGDNYLQPVLAAQAAAATLQLTPAPASSPSATEKESS